MSMQKHIQSIAALAALQLTCLAFGLWVQDRILIETADWDVRAQVAKQKVDGVAKSVPADAARSQMKAESLLRFMPQVRMLTLAWTGALQLVTLHLLINRMRTDHSKSRERSQLEFMRQESDLVRTRNAVIFGLANLAESRDRETGRHLERIAIYSTRLASALRNDSQFHHRVSASLVRTIGISSVLHDIGKVGVRDSILLKPGPLTADERLEMQKHTEIGSDCLQQIERRLGSSNFLHIARQIALYHHESWDGNGYPQQLSGEAIPLVARIVAIADMYDALSVERVYKQAFPHHQCVEIIRQEAGKHLDPEIVAVFLRIEHEFAAIAKKFTDESLNERRQDIANESLFVPPPGGEEEELVETVLEFEKTIEKALVDVQCHTAV